MDKRVLTDPKNGDWKSSPDLQTGKVSMDRIGPVSLKTPQDEPCPHDGVRGTINFDRRMFKRGSGRGGTPIAEPDAKKKKTQNATRLEEGGRTKNDHQSSRMPSGHSVKKKNWVGEIKNPRMSGTVCRPKPRVVQAKNLMSRNLGSRQKRKKKI